MGVIPVRKRVQKEKRNILYSDIRGACLCEIQGFLFCYCTWAGVWMTHSVAPYPSNWIPSFQGRLLLSSLSSVTPHLKEPPVKLTSFLCWQLLDGVRGQEPELPSAVWALSGGEREGLLPPVFFLPPTSVSPSFLQVFSDLKVSLCPP